MNINFYCWMCTVSKADHVECIVSNLLTTIWGDSYLLGICLQTCVLGLYIEVFHSRVIECVDTDILKSLQSGLAID